MKATKEIDISDLVTNDIVNQKCIQILINKNDLPEGDQAIFVRFDIDLVMSTFPIKHAQRYISGYDHGWRTWKPESLEHYLITNKKSD